MSEELVKIEGDLERQQREFEEALERGYVADPTGGILTAAIIAIGASFLSAGLQSLLPRPGLPSIERGRMTGQFFLSSEQGLMIPEVYGADPGDGKGGVKFAPIIIWTSGIRKLVNVTRQEVGGGKGPRTQTQEVQNISYEIDLGLLWCRGPALAKRLWANASTIYDVDAGRAIYEGESASSYTAPYQIGDNSQASNGKEVVLQNSGGGTAAVQWNTVQSVGATTRTLTFWFATTGTLTAEIYVNGVLVNTASLPNSSNTFRAYTIDSALNNGSNTVKIVNKSATLNLRIDRLYCFPGHSATNQTTGVLDEAASPDTNYDHELPPDPQANNTVPFNRHNAELDIDYTGAQTGTIAHGGYSGLAIYKGTFTQLPDPVMEAAVDGLFGANSTPAYRGRAWSRHSSFSLTKYGNIVPNLQGAFESETLKNLQSISGHWCSRVNIESTDYDFSGLSTVNVRGLLLAGRRYSPAEIMQTCSRVYNVYYNEVEGQIMGHLQGTASVATIDDSELGWTDSEDTDGPLPELDIILTKETDLPRRVDVKFQDVDQDYEPNTQGEARQITDGETPDLLEVQIAMTATEARQLAVRDLYDQYVKGTKHRFNLSWEYLYLNPGDTITVPRDEGFTHTIQLTSIKGGIGVLECEGVALDEAVFTQSTLTDGGNGFEVPPVPIPASTICFLLDTPILRDVDATTNNGAGFYACATPRTSDGQAWSGASLYVSKIGWERIADFRLPATMGRATTVLADVSNPSVLDTTSTVTVDLYGTTQTLSSATTDDLYAGANAALLGNEVIQFATATRVEGQPNRWTLSNFLRARRRTIHQTSTHVVNERFCLLNEAVQFVPINVSEVNAEREYKAVSAAQSLDDAATVTFAWLGGSLKTFAPDFLRGTRQTNNDWRFTCQRAARIAQAMRPFSAAPLGEERLIFDWTIMDGSDEIRTTRIFDTSVQPATLLDRSDVSDVGISTHSRQITEQRLDLEDSYVMANFTLDVAESLSVGLVDNNGAGMISDGSGGTAFDSSWLVTAGFTGDDLFGIIEQGVTVYSETLPAATEATLRLEIKNSVLRYYLDYENASSLPIYTSTRTDFAGRDLRGYFFRSSGVAFSQQRVKVGQPTYIYTEAEQEADFGSAQSTIKVRVRQVSTIVGPGDYAEGEFSG